jgi:dipeptidyl aminopeptidase/acylaminoacyl peptidase
LLADDTHKFELQYMIKLLGGTKQEIPQVYHDRSPVYYSANIKTPLLVCFVVDEVRSDGYIVYS